MVFNSVNIVVLVCFEILGAFSGFGKFFQIKRVIVIMAEYSGGICAQRDMADG